MKYGYFDDHNKEYVITNPHTPTKWINYIGGLDFGGFIDHLGGGVICKGDPALNRIVKYIPQLPDSSFNGESIYIRLKTKKGVQVFSPLYVPTLDGFDSYKCRVGLGYNIYETEFYGIKTKITAFVPRDNQVVIKHIEITNTLDEVVEIDVIPVVEYTHFEALKQFTNADWVPQTMMSEKHFDDQYTILTQYAFMKKTTDVNYFTSNVPASSFETDRRRFLKDNQGGTWQNPKSLLADELSNYEAERGDNIAALMHHMGSFKKNDSKVLITQLGQYSNYQTELEQIHHFRKSENVLIAFEALKEFWDEHLDVMSIHTPSESMNSMINIHNPKQCYTTKNWSRYLSLYQLGLGARGIGIRDSSQDTMGMISQKPEEARVLITTLLSMQRMNGSAYHQYNPKSLEATEGDSREEEEAPDYYGDDHLWLVLAVSEYLKETGAYEFLDELVPYYEKDSDNKPKKMATVKEHLKAALEFSKTDVGQHGIPHLGFADWNDTVNLRTGSESFFNANLYGVALKEYLDLLKFLEDDSYDLYHKDYLHMRDTFQKIAWDGKWFRRYIDVDGAFLGSHENAEGKIFTNGQSWSVMSGFATVSQGRQALESVHDILNTSKGIKLSYPGYNGYDPHKGGVSSYPPGAKENGGIFLHSNPWVMIAETMYGHGNRAFEYYHQINPIAKNDVIDEYETAPYVYPQNVLGDEHKQFGLARNCWLSGTASWSYQAATKYILGIKPTHKGLLIDPCIPNDWETFRVKRKIRNATFNIVVNNPDHIEKGVKTITIDGQVISGKVLPYLDGKHNVEVLMGE